MTVSIDYRPAPPGRLYALMRSMIAVRIRCCSVFYALRKNTHHGLTMAFQCFERSERKKTWTLLSAHFVETQKSSDRAFIPSADKLFYALTRPILSSPKVDCVVKI